jgi:hypothetical protein
LKWWGLILLLTLLFAATLVTVALRLLKPAFESVDQLEPGQIRSIRAFVLNRPDGGPDIGDRKGGMEITGGDLEKVLAPLRHAARIDKERGVWLGQITVKLADGRGQTIMLHRAQPDPQKPWVLRFKIGTFQYEAGPVSELIEVLSACEGRSQPVGPD